MTTKAMRRGKLSKGVTFDLGCTGLEEYDDDYTKSPPPVQWSTHPGLPRSHSLASPDEFSKNNTHDIILKLKSIAFENSRGSQSIIEEETEVINHQGTSHILISEQNGSCSEDTLGSTSTDSLSQTLPSLSNDSSSAAKPTSISGKLEQLNNDLKILQEQDISLLKQLMQIHFTMRMLKRGAYRRTSSMCVSRYRPAQIEHEATTPTPTKRKGPHPVLSRVQSEPGRYGFMCSSSFSSMEDEDIDEIEEDYLANSCNSVDLDNESSHYSSYLKLSLDLNDGTSDLLEDMPLPLRRKYLNSLTDNTTIPSRWPDRFKNQKSLEQRRQSLSRQDALQNLDLSRSSSLESDGGIELPAITVQ